MSGYWRSDKINRRTFVKQGVGMAIAAGSAAGLLGAGQARAAGTPASPTIKRGGVLRDVGSVTITTLDRHLANTGLDVEMHLMHDTFFRRALVSRAQETYETRPALAESHRLINPTTMELRLRRGVKFHDGSDFNASVAAWNIERAGSHPKSMVKATVAPVSRVEVVDDFTLRLHLKKPSGILPLLLSDAANPPLAMVSRAAVAKLGDERYASNPVGTGPMKFKEWVKDDRVVLEKFPGHWERGLDGQPLPYLDGLVMRWMLDSAAVLMELKAGSVDSVRSQDVTDVAAVRADPNLVAQPMPGIWNSYPGMYINPRPNTPYPFSNNQKLRQAAQYAIDRESMAKALGGGLARPAYYPFFFPGMPGYDESLPKYEFNLARAKQLVAEAGYPNGVDLEVKVINRPGDLRPLEALQAMYAAAGIRLKIAALDRAVWIEDGRAGRFEALSHFWSQYFDVLAAPYSKTAGFNNWSGYSNPAVDKLYEQAESEYDEAKRAEVYKTMQKVHHEGAYFITGFMNPRMTYMNKRVRDMTNHYLYRHVWLG